MPALLLWSPWSRLTPHRECRAPQSSPSLVGWQLSTGKQGPEGKDQSHGSFSAGRSQGATCTHGCTGQGTEPLLSPAPAPKALGEGLGSPGCGWLRDPGLSDTADSHFGEGCGSSAPGRVRPSLSTALRCWSLERSQGHRAHQPMLLPAGCFGDRLLSSPVTQLEMPSAHLGPGRAPPF